jgi:hypothetical protein
MFSVGIDHAAQEFWNAQLEVDYGVGDIGNKEYAREHWKEDD